MKLTKVVALGVLLLAGFTFLASVRDLQRYIKISSM